LLAELDPHRNKNYLKHSKSYVCKNKSVPWPKCVSLLHCQVFQQKVDITKEPQQGCTVLFVKKKRWIKNGINYDKQSKWQNVCAGEAEGRDDDKEQGVGGDAAPSHRRQGNQHHIFSCLDMILNMLLNMLLNSTAGQRQQSTYCLAYC